MCNSPDKSLYSYQSLNLEVRLKWSCVISHSVTPVSASAGSHLDPLIFSVIYSCRQFQRKAFLTRVHQFIAICPSKQSRLQCIFTLKFGCTQHIHALEAAACLLFLLPGIFTCLTLGLFLPARRVIFTSHLLYRPQREKKRQGFSPSISRPTKKGEGILYAQVMTQSMERQRKFSSLATCGVLATKTDHHQTVVTRCIVRCMVTFILWYERPIGLVHTWWRTALWYVSCGHLVLDK